MWGRRRLCRPVTTLAPAALAASRLRPASPDRTPSPIPPLTAGSSRPRGPRLALRLDEILARNAHPHHQRRHDQHRRVDAEADADRQRQREVVQRLAAEEQDRQHHHQRAAVGDDRPRDRAGDRVVDDVRHGRLAHLAEILADPVGDHDRLVHRIAQHREHRRQHRQRELPLEQREEAQDDDDVVQVGDDRRDGEAPLEAHREVADDAERDQQQRERAVLVELLADLRADELDALLRGRRVVGAQRAQDALGELRARHAFLQRQADQRGVGAAEALRRIVAQAERVDGAAHAVEIHGVAVDDLDDRAAAEIDAEVQAARGEEDHGEHERHERNHVERERKPHERDVAPDAEEFHGSVSCGGAVVAAAVYFAGAPAAGAGRHTWPMEILVEVLAAAVDEVDDPARDEHRREHRRHDAEAMDDGEAAHGTAAEDQQRDAGDQRRHVRVEDRAERALVARRAAPHAASRPSAAPRGCAR